MLRNLLTSIANGGNCAVQMISLLLYVLHAVNYRFTTTGALEIGSGSGRVKTPQIRRTPERTTPSETRLFWDCVETRRGA